jgi:hypothetical protein
MLLRKAMAPGSGEKESDNPVSEPKSGVRGYTERDELVNSESFDDLQRSKNAVLSIVKLSDVRGEPAAKLDLPGPLKIGDPLGLKFRVERKNGGRTEELVVDGQFRVTAVGFDTASGAQRQLLSVEAAYGKPPVWHSVKNPSEPPRRLSPARSPRTPI